MLDSLFVVYSAEIFHGANSYVTPFVYRFGTAFATVEEAEEMIFRTAEVDKGDVTYNIAEYFLSPDGFLPPF